MLSAFVCTFFLSVIFFPLSNYFSDNKTGKLFVIKPTAGIALPLPSRLYLGRIPLRGPNRSSLGAARTGRLASLTQQSDAKTGDCTLWAGSGL